MERKTITIKEFEAQCGFTWMDILRLGWLEKNCEDKVWYIFLRYIRTPYEH